MTEEQTRQCIELCLELADRHDNGQYGEYVSRARAILRPKTAAECVLYYAMVWAGAVRAAAISSNSTHESDLVNAVERYQRERGDK